MPYKNKEQNKLSNKQSRARHRNSYNMYQRKWNWKRRGLDVERAQHLHDTIKYCQICENEDPKLHIDHCHKTGLVRGILCHKCNRALGFFKDDSTLLRKAADYVDKHGNTVYN